MRKKFVLRGHPRPLERRERLRNKVRRAHGHGNLAVPLLLRNPVILLGNLLGKLRDSDRILIAFARKPEHEVQLYLVPPAAERFAGAAENVFNGQPLVNHVTHALRARFGGKCDTRLVHILHLLHDIERKRVDSKRRKRNIHIPVFIIVNQIIYKVLQARIIARTEGT